MGIKASEEDFNLTIITDKLLKTKTKMKAFTSLALAAIFSAAHAQAIDDWPEGSICCRAYPEKRHKGEP